MTTPQERFRALVWGAELLAEIALDDSMPAQMQQETQRLRVIYPSAQELIRWVRSPPTEISSEHCSAIRGALALFQAVQGSDYGRPSTRRSILFALRHFPSKSLVATWERGFWPTVADWLEEDA